MDRKQWGPAPPLEMIGRTSTPVFTQVAYTGSMGYSGAPFQNYWQTGTVAPRYHPSYEASKAMKFLCVCQGGNVRSVALAMILKKYGQDAIAIGWAGNTKETLALFSAWADKIIVMQEEFKELIPGPFRAKVRAVDVGPDVYGTPMHPSLTSWLEEVVVDWERRNFQI